VAELLKNDFSVTSLNRGQVDDGFINQITRLKVDRKNKEHLKEALKNSNWDLVIDNICFEARDARDLCDLLRDRTERLLVTSSQSIYPFGENLLEEEFDPSTHTFEKDADAKIDYAEAKRQVESEVIKHLNLKPVLVRLPFVTGPDDYTKRFQWHIDRIKNGQEIYFPEPEAKICFLRSVDAGQTFVRIACSNHVDPINCANQGALKLCEIMDGISKSVGKQWQLATQADEGNYSPYGIEKSWTLNLSRLSDLGIQLDKINNWILEI
jgi:nucleoside-diphosphate-sugar epimerase